MDAYTLYDLSQEAAEILDLVKNGTFSEEDIKDTLEAAQRDVKKGVRDLAGVVKELDPQIDVLDQHIKSLQGRKKVLEERQSKLKSIIGTVMHSSGVKDVQTNFFTVLCKPGTESVDITDKNAIPVKFVKTKTTETQDKKAIKAALNNGEDVPGAKLVKTDFTVQIS